MRTSHRVGRAVAATTVALAGVLATGMPLAHADEPGSTPNSVARTSVTDVAATVSPDETTVSTAETTVGPDETTVVTNETTVVTETGPDGAETSIVLIPATSATLPPSTDGSAPAGSHSSSPIETGASTTVVEVLPTTSQGGSVVVETLSPGTTVTGPDAEVIVLGPAVQATSVLSAEPQVQVAPAVEGSSPGTTFVLPGADGTETTIALGPARSRSVAPAGPAVPARTAEPRKQSMVLADPAVTPARTPGPVEPEVLVLGTSAAAAPATSTAAGPAFDTAGDTLVAADIELQKADLAPTEVAVDHAASTATDTDSPVASVLAAGAVILVLGGGLWTVRRRVAASRS